MFCLTRWLFKLSRQVRFLVILQAAGIEYERWWWNLVQLSLVNKTRKDIAYSVNTEYSIFLWLNSVDWILRHEWESKSSVHAQTFLWGAFAVYLRVEERAEESERERERENILPNLACNGRIWGGWRGIPHKHGLSVLTDWKVRSKTAPTCFRLSTSSER